MTYQRFLRMCLFCASIVMATSAIPPRALAASGCGYWTITGADARISTSLTPDPNDPFCSSFLDFKNVTATSFGPIPISGYTLRLDEVGTGLNAAVSPEDIPLSIPNLDLQFKITPMNTGLGGSYFISGSMPISSIAADIIVIAVSEMIPTSCIVDYQELAIFVVQAESNFETAAKYLMSNPPDIVGFDTSIGPALDALTQSLSISNNITGCLRSAASDLLADALKTTAYRFNLLKDIPLWAENRLIGIAVNGWTAHWEIDYTPKSTSPTPPSPCSGSPSATFVQDMTYPDGSTVSAGQQFSKTWRLKNTGNCTWNGYALKFAAGAQMGGPGAVSVPSTAAGQTVDLTVPLAAPQASGSYAGYWQLEDDQGTNVPGGYVWVKVSVPSTGGSPSGGSSSGGSSSLSLGFSTTSAQSGSAIDVDAQSSNPAYNTLRASMLCGSPQYYENGAPQIHFTWSTSGCPAGNQTVTIQARTSNDPSWSQAIAISGVVSISAAPTPPPIIVPPDARSYIRCGPGFSFSSCSANGEYGDGPTDAAWRGADGDLNTQWSSLEQLNSYWQATFQAAVPVSQVSIWGRGGGDTLSGKLQFSDGSAVDLGTLNGSGCRRSLSFPTRTTSFVRFQITGLGNRQTTGFREIEAYKDKIYPDGDDWACQTTTLLPAYTPPPRVSLGVNANSVYPGQQVAVAWANLVPPGNDWISLYTTGAADGQYVSLQAIAGASGSLTFTAPTIPGSYEYRLFANGTKVATSSPWTVVTPPTPTLTVNQTSVLVGQPVSVSWDSFLATGNDWVSLHISGVPDSQYISWQRINGSGGTIVFAAPTVPGSYNFLLFASGTRVAASPNFQVVGQPLVRLDRTGVDFTDQPVGTSSAPQELTLSNVGTAPLAISSITTIGDFNQTNTCGVSIAAAASCVITVSFAPTVAGVRSGAITIADSAPGGPQSIPLGGQGTSKGTDDTRSLDEGNGQTSGQTITVAPGQALDLYSVMKNTGTSTWDSTYELGQCPLPACGWPASETPQLGFGNNNAASVTGSVAPGATQRFDFHLTAPTTTGTYYAHFEMANTGTHGFFGPPVSLQVQVTSGAGTGVSCMDPTKVSNIQNILAGTLTIGGSPAPAGTKVTALFNGTVTGCVTTQQSGQYLLIVNGSDGQPSSAGFPTGGQSYQVAINDSTTGVAPPTLTFQAPPSGQQFTTVTANLSQSSTVTESLPLAVGWHLIGLTVSPSSTRLQDVLASIAGQYDIVYGFDASAGGAQSYFTAPGMRGFNTLTDLLPLHGYWVHLTAPANLTLSGSALSASNALTLQPGDWSLIGYSGSSPEPLATALGHLNNAVDIVYGFDASQGGALSYFSTAGMSQFNTLHELEPAQGYWVHLTGTPPQTWSGQ